jgi:hypothetical protein
MKTTEQIAILRRCARCKQYESIDRFKGLGKVCYPCMRTSGVRRIGNRGQANARRIAITESGRELLRQWREEEQASAA